MASEPVIAPGLPIRSGKRMFMLPDGTTVDLNDPAVQAMIRAQIAGAGGGDLLGPEPPQRPAGIWGPGAGDVIYDPYKAAREATSERRAGAARVLQNIPAGPITGALSAMTGGASQEALTSQGLSNPEAPNAALAIESLGLNEVPGMGSSALTRQLADYAGAQTGSVSPRPRVATPRQGPITSREVAEILERWKEFAPEASQRPNAIAAKVGAPIEDPMGQYAAAADLVEQGRGIAANLTGEPSVRSTKTIPLEAMTPIAENAGDVIGINPRGFASTYFEGQPDTGAAALRARLQEVIPHEFGHGGEQGRGGTAALHQFASAPYPEIGDVVNPSLTPTLKIGEQGGQGRLPGEADMTLDFTPEEYAALAPSTRRRFSLGDEVEPVQVQDMVRGNLLSDADARAASGSPSEHLFQTRSESVRNSPEFQALVDQVVSKYGAGGLSGQEEVLSLQPGRGRPEIGMATRDKGQISQMLAEREMARNRAVADDINFGYTKPDGTVVPPGGLVKFAKDMPGMPEKFAGEVTITDDTTGSPVTFNIWRDPDGTPYASVLTQRTSGGFRDSFRAENLEAMQALKKKALAEFAKAGGK